MKSALTFSAVFCVVVIGVELNANDDWPQFRGPTGDGHSTSTGLPTAWSEEDNVVWKTPIHGRGWSSPVVAGKRIWVTTATADGKKMSVLCVDRDSGDIVYDRLLFTNEKPRKIHTLNGYASPTPVVEGDRVYVHFGSYGTAALDAKSGDKLWERRDLPCHHWRGPGSSPIVYRDRLIIHYDGFDFQYVVALNKSNGDTIWKTDRSNDFGGSDNGDFKKAYATPIIVKVDGADQLISPGSRAAFGYDPMSGDELWRVRFQSFSSTVRPLYGNGLLYINTGFGKADLIAVQPGGKGDVTATHVKWTQRKSIGSKPSSVLVGDLIFGVHDKGVASCVDAKTGDQVWAARLKGQFSSSAVYVDGLVWFFSHDGVATAIRPSRKFEKAAENKLDDGFMASPAIAGKAFFLRTKTHLYRIEKKS